MEPFHIGKIDPRQDRPERVEASETKDIDGRRAHTVRVAQANAKEHRVRTARHGDHRQDQDWLRGRAGLAPRMMAAHVFGRCEDEAWLLGM